MAIFISFTVSTKSIKYVQTTCKNIYSTLTVDHSSSWGVRGIRIFLSLEHLVKVGLLGQEEKRDQMRDTVKGPCSRRKGWNDHFIILH